MNVKGSGLHHIGFTTHSIEKTIEFYNGVLGFDILCYYLREERELGGEGNGAIRQVFFDLGNGQALEFAEAHDMSTFPEGYDTSINKTLGLEGAFFGVSPNHFAFNCNTEEELQQRLDALIAADVEPFGILELDWLKSIYFMDPVNGLQLEFGYTVKKPGEDYFKCVDTPRWEELRKKAEERSA